MKKEKVDRYQQYRRSWRKAINGKWVKYEDYEKLRKRAQVIITKQSDVLEELAKAGNDLASQVLEETL